MNLAKFALATLGPACLMLGLAFTLARWVSEGSTPASQSTYWLKGDFDAHDP